MASSFLFYIVKSAFWVFVKELWAFIEFVHPFKRPCRLSKDTIRVTKGVIILDFKVDATSVSILGELAVRDPSLDLFVTVSPALDSK